MCNLFSERLFFSLQRKRKGGSLAMMPAESCADGRTSSSAVKSIPVVCYQCYQMTVVTSAAELVQKILWNLSKVIRKKSFQMSVWHFAGFCKETGR